MEPTSRDIFLNCYNKLASLLISEHCIIVNMNITDPSDQYRFLIDVFGGLGIDNNFDINPTSYCLSWILDWFIKIRNDFVHRPKLPLSNICIWNISKHIIPCTLGIYNKLKLSNESRRLLINMIDSLKMEVKRDDKDNIKDNISINLELERKRCLSSQQKRTERDWSEHVPILKSIAEPSIIRKLVDFKDDKKLMNLFLGKDIQIMSGIHAGFMAKIMLWNGNNVSMILSTAEHKYIETNKAIKFPSSYLEE